MDETSGGGSRCPWCSVAVHGDATTCPACGAAIAQRESIGDLVIPGVTAVDPALRAYDAQPLHIPGPSPSQGLAAGAVAAAASGGIGGLAVLGGVAAVAAAEYLGARRTDGGPPVDLDHLGEPSEAARLMLERIEREGEPGATGEGAASQPPAPGAAAPDARPRVDEDRPPRP